jgi:hypothetical protein
MDDSTYTDHYDDNDSICPYCGDKFQVEGEDYDEQPCEIQCFTCGRKYWLSQMFTVTHRSRPDCELNGMKHNFQPRAIGGGKTYPFCVNCDYCKPYRKEET